MTDEPKRDEPAADAQTEAVAHHDAATHMDAHAVLSDDGHAEAALGPIDWSAWAYALIGGTAGLIVLLVFWVAVGGPG